jgi:peptide/nickel transport system substrate-binding protein
VLPREEGLTIMRSRARPRLVRGLLATGLVFGLLLPAGVPAAADNHRILRAGTDQDLQVLNPWNSVVVADFEVYTLNYDLLLNFGPDLEPVPGFAESWTQSDDGLTWTFKIREGMLWSDGEPATSADVVYTYQLVIDATELSNESEDGYYLGYGYLEPYLTNAGIVSVSAPDPQTVVVATEFANTLLTQSYVPILPAHIWSEYTLDDIAGYSDTPFNNEPPVVGTGPYQAIEWQPGEFVRLGRNPNYWGPEGAADEVIIQHFSSPDTMVQALRRGDIDYVRDVQPDQFEALRGEPNIAVAEGVSNGYTELAFNTRGNLDGYGGRTAALTDVAFRDALGYAIDNERLVEAALNGYGEVGSTIIPPFHTRWHAQPDNPRRFDLDEARRRLDAAGYVLDGQGRRLDKAGQPLNLRLTWPDSGNEGATLAQFVTEWFGELGITVEAAVTEEGKLIEDLLPPPEGEANFDMFFWGWVGDPDPTSLLNFFRTDEIGGSSDSFYSNERFDELFLLQRAEADPAERLEYLTEIQNLVYDEAPYHVLYYDSDLHAYRTDRFGGWRDQPTEGGTPLFAYGSGGYTVLTDLTAQPSPEPTDSGPAPSGAPSPAPSGSPSDSPAGSDSTPLILGVIVLVVVLAGGFLVLRRRSAAAAEEE